MEVIREYAITLGWIVCFLLLAIGARYLFDWISPFSLREPRPRRTPRLAASSVGSTRACHPAHRRHVLDP